MNLVDRLTGVRFHEVAPRALFLSYRLLDRAMPALLVASAYYVGCLTGFALRLPSSGISFFWPPTAVLTVAAWPIQFFGNASQAALAAWIVRRYSTTPWTFASARSVLVFILGAGMLAPAAASLIPASVYVSLGWAADLRQAWRVRTISNAIAMLTIVPPLLLRRRRSGVRVAGHRARDGFHRAVRPRTAAWQGDG